MGLYRHQDELELNLVWKTTFKDNSLNIKCIADTHKGLVEKCNQNGFFANSQMQKTCETADELTSFASLEGYLSEDMYS